jgi:transposase InsO family protein
MGRVASSVDNTLIESFWSTMQRELLDTRDWDSPERLSSAIFEWIEAWYNPRRRHTSIADQPRPSSSNFTEPPLPRHDRPTRRDVDPVQRTRW